MSLRRSDMPVPVRTRDGRVFVVLLAVQSRREADAPLRLSEDDLRHRWHTGPWVPPWSSSSRPPHIWSSREVRFA